MAVELVDSWFKEGCPAILCKLDIEKAYDNVDLGFLLYVLE